MAENDIVFRTQVDTGSTVQDLERVTGQLENIDEITGNTQDQFNTLRKSIKEASAAVDEQAKKFGQNSKEADNARKTLAALNIEYAELAQTTTDLGASFEDVYGELQPLSTRLAEVEDRMYELAAAGQAQGDEFQALVQEAANYRRTITEVDRAVDNLAENGRGLGTALQIGSAVVAGYGALQGAMSLFGNESKEVQEIMVKLQATQAILNGLQQIKIFLDGQSVVAMKLNALWTKTLAAGEVIYAAAIGGTTGAMKALRIAMLALPIVAIIAAIAALVAGIAWLISEEEKAEKANEALTVSYERQAAVFERTMNKRQRLISEQIELAKAQGKSAQEIHALEMKALEEGEIKRVAAAKMEKKLIDDRTVQYYQALKEENWELAKSIQKEIEASRNKYLDLRSLDGKYKHDMTVAELNFQNEQKKIKDQEVADAKKKQDELDKQAAEAAKKQNEEAKRRREERRKREAEELALEKEFQNKMLDLAVENLTNVSQREIAALSLRQQRETEDFKTKYGKQKDFAKLMDELRINQEAEVMALMDKQEKDYDAKEAEKLKAKQEKENTDRKAKLEADLIAMREDQNAKFLLDVELAAMEREFALQNKELTAGEIAKIEETYNAKLVDLNAEFEKKKQAQNAETAEKRKQLEDNVFAAIQNLSDIWFAIKWKKDDEDGKNAEKRAKQQFKINKAMQLAGAIIDGFRSVTTALASAPPPVNFVLAAASGLAAAATVAKIAATQFESTSSGGGTSVSPPAVTPAQARPQSNPFNQGTSQQTSGGSGNNGDDEDDDSKPGKVYVVDSDITGVQQATKRVKAVSTFG